MTEEEAKQKRCCGPEGLGIPYGSVEVCHDDATPLVFAPIRWCIGSECMAWRTRPAGVKSVKHPDGEDTTGFCGLAGPP